MNLVKIMLNNRSQRQKATYYTIPFIRNVQNWPIHRVSTDRGCQGPWGKWTGSDWQLMGAGFFRWKEHSDTDGGDAAQLHRHSKDHCISCWDQWITGYGNDISRKLLLKKSLRLWWASYGCVYNRLPPGFEMKSPPCSFWCPPNPTWQWALPREGSFQEKSWFPIFFPHAHVFISMPHYTQWVPPSKAGTRGLGRGEHPWCGPPKALPSCHCHQNVYWIDTLADKTQQMSAGSFWASFLKRHRESKGPLSAFECGCMKMGWLELLQLSCDHEATDTDAYTEEGPAGEWKRDAARAPAVITQRSQPRCAACVLGHDASFAFESRWDGGCAMCNQ